MKSLTVFMRLVLMDLGTRCSVSTSRDIQTVTARCEDEGLSFLTITLPAFGKGFQKSLDLGRVDSDLFKGFAFRGGLPAFMSGFLRRVFDSKTGLLLDNPCVHSIYAVRQFTLMWQKIKLDCSPRRVESAFARYVECERDVREADRRFDTHRSDFRRVSRLLFWDYLHSVDNLVATGGIVPRHSSGATANGIKGNLKYSRLGWSQRLEFGGFHSADYLIPNHRYWEDLQSVHFAEPGDEIPVRVITVPKTLKTPRIIAEEPSYVQYAQQGLLEALTERLREFTIPYSLVSSDSQDPNRELARLGSVDGSLATLDLSEASDRVSNQHVRELLQDHPHLFEAVDACRSRKADVPGYGVIRLAKFASMGSALCFPFEAMVFATAVFMGIERGLSRQLTRGDIRRISRQVRVYGDDIIVPVDYARPVVEVLEGLGFRVGADKSFWNGKFRESCGAEWYGGHDVSIVKVRRLFPRNRQDAQEIASAVSLRNLLSRKTCFDLSVAYLDAMLERLIPLPLVRESSPILGRWTDYSLEYERTCPELHRPLVRGAVLVSVLPSSKLDGVPALMKYFLKRGDDPYEREHLERAGRPVSVSIKTGWFSPE